MVSDLHLRGSELIAYAVIYSHCKRYGCYDKPISYLSEWLGCSERHMKRCLSSLICSGVISREKRNGKTSIVTPTRDENVTPSYKSSHKELTKELTKEKREKSVSRTREADATLGTHFFLVEKTFFLCGLYRPIEEAAQFVSYYDSVGWVDKEGNPIRSVISRAKVWFAQDNAKGVYPSSRLMTKEAKQECSRIIKELYQQRNQYDLQRTFVEGLYQIIETTNDTIKLIAGEAFVQKIATDSIFRNAVGRGREILVRNLEKELKRRESE